MADLVLKRLDAQFASPIILASGPAGFGVELAPALDLPRIGAITTKTITIEPRTGNDQPRLVDCPSGALNSNVESCNLSVPTISPFTQRIGVWMPCVPSVRSISWPVIPCCLACHTSTK